MGLRDTSLRVKVFALLIALVGLWSFAAWITVRDGLNLFSVQVVKSNIAEPMESWSVDLQVERRLSVAYLAAPSEKFRAELDAQRARSAADADNFRAKYGSWETGFATDPELRRRIDLAASALDRLGATRASIDARTIDRTAAAAAFTGAIEAMFYAFDVMGRFGDPEISDNGAALIQLNLVRELVSQEDALITGALEAKQLTAGEQTAFSQLVGAKRFVVNDTMAALPSSDRARFTQTEQADPAVRFRAIEDQVMAGRPNAPLAVGAAEWRAVADATLDGLRLLVLAGGDALVERAIPVVVWIIIRLLIAAVLGLIAVIVSINAARTSVRQLEQLRQAALRLANERLPDVVARLGRGETVDVGREAPPLRIGRHEIGEVAQAFNAAQETAIRVAVEQADLRRGVRNIFLSLARRTQALLHRQLTLLDEMERREEDATKLEDLFRLDHLATRMRRNAENLIVLSGAAPGRAWRRNVPMVDVLRGALAEVEDYTRVEVRPPGPAQLAGRAVSDVIHLLAELIENSLSFSPPHTSVVVSGESVATGFAIDIEDRGLGMTDAERSAANDRIANRTEFTLSRATQLGLYVVSRLSERHGVRVHLKSSPYGGITTVVLIPRELVSMPGDGSRSAGGPDAPSGAAPAIHSESRPHSGTKAGTVAPTTAVAPPASSIPHASSALPISSVPPAAPVGVDRVAPAAAAAEVPAAAEQPPPETLSGLPVRRRKQALAPAPRADGPAGDPTVELDPAPMKSPDRVRRTMSSYQAGTRQARADVAQGLHGSVGPRPDPDPTRDRVRPWSDDRTDDQDADRAPG